MYNNENTLASVLPETMNIAPTIKTRLEHQKQDLENRLEKINGALDLLKKNPELQAIFDAVSRVF